ncbi:MAG: hypothetical protein U1G07_00505 [Verrucomicrobiota bacterium]
MTPHILARLACFLGLATGISLSAQEPRLRQLTESADPTRALVRVQSQQRSSHPIPRFITGKFAEHLGFNIYNGMDAQILRNPTFAHYPFWNGQMSPDGVTRFQADDARIKDELRHQASRFGWPGADLNELTAARSEALAPFWMRLGKDVRPSADAGPAGGRAQRLGIKAAGQGIGQWTWLPLHRQRQYELELMVRSPDIKSLTVAIVGQDQKEVSSKLDGIADGWTKLTARLTIPPEWRDDLAYRFSVTADSPGQLVLRHVFLRPADHIHGADPDIVALLKESHLPLLRWPGGNFVSTYHWQHAVGPVEQRLTEPNLAWGSIEPNTFGTDEFIAFCRAVGCEPMICVNAGSGTPAEAAQWIEYCNGPSDSRMGRLRAAHGHPEPYGVKYWEVGNELWGRWQMHWTTPEGYVDRFKHFAPAMRAADPTIQLYSCGAPAMTGRDWNRTLITGASETMGTITDHPLIGGDVSRSTDPLDVYRDFMAVPEVLQSKWETLREDMRQGGVTQPRLAVTELQLFAHLAAKAEDDAPDRLTYATLPGQGSITEAIYDILVYHAAVRLQPFVELITHSAVVNHGGGLRKERERVWANPCHYAQSAFAAFAETTPVALQIQAAMEQAPLVLPDLKRATTREVYSVIDALAAQDKQGGLLLSIVHRGSAGKIELTIDIPDFAIPDAAEVTVLQGESSWAGNSFDQPALIKPRTSRIAPSPAAGAAGGQLQLTLSPFSLAKIYLPKKDH